MKKAFERCMIAGAGGAGALLPMAAVFAADASDIPDEVNPITGGGDLSVAGVIKSVIIFVLGFAAAIAVLFLVIGGILYMVSGGNEDKVKKARSMIFAAIIGLLVIILSYVIVNFTTKTVEEVGGGADTQSEE